MIIQYASDLHLEFPDNRKYLKETPLIPKGDVLVLAGDIVLFKVMHEHDDFFDYLSDNFDQTFWVPGNHEYYYSDINGRSGELNEKIRSNVSIVNNISLKHENVLFIFSTLWSAISQANQWRVQQSLSDFHVIADKAQKFNPDRYNSLHTESLRFIKDECGKYLDEKKVVVTHHVPTYLHYPEKYKGDSLNEAFATELHDFIADSGISSWIYGHHHHNCDEFVIGNTMMRTNQLGYVKYNENFGFRHDNHIVV
jgi:predicted phosphohydrolase